MKQVLVALSAGVSLCALSGQARAADALAAAPASGDVIIVNGTAATQPSASATGLALTPMQTPQAITVVDQAQIKDFALTTVNDLLDQVPGINVERAETDRTEYDARGFGVTNFQVDGIGLPLVDSGIAYGSLDTALWDKVEVVRGANGMMTGVGNPSATVNYVRKRPTDTFQASVTGTLGSYNDHRIEGDISGPLTRDGTVRARLIGVHEDSDSYLDYYHVNRYVIGGIISWDITSHLQATAGYNRQQNNARGVMWGALPLSYADGGQVYYPSSASTAAPWTYWNTLSQSAFAEMKYDLGGGWSVKGVYTHNQTKYQAKLLYAYGYADRDTGLGVTGTSGIYPSDYNQNIEDFYVSGPFQLLGRKHDLAFGVSHGTTSTREYEGDSYDEIDYPSVSQLGTVAPAEPTDYTSPTLQANMIDRLTRVYGAIHWNITDQLKAITGFAATWLDTTGQSYGVDEGRKNSKVTPYVGALYDLTPHITAYASYTGIFNPQAQVDVNNRRLDPATGSSVEAGVKSQWFGGRLYATAAWFHARQNNLAEAAGTFGEDGAGPAGDTYYAGQTTISKGIELEVAGKITPNWTINGGYTGFSLRTPDGQRAFGYIPNRTFKLSTTYALPQLHDLKLGAAVRWQNGTYYVDSGVQDAAGNDAVIRQPHYAVLDLMASARVVDRVRASINLRNVTNTKYLNSLAWGQAYYAEPRTVMGSLSFTY